MSLLKKEIRLCMHPTAYLMMGMFLMLLIPNYPYLVSFFYTTLGIFFIFITARENHDAAFTLSLPLSRRDAVKGRMLLCLILEAIQLALSALVLPLHRVLLGDLPNSAGMDANIALIGEGFLVFSLFNLLFFPTLYRDINKVGRAFALSCVGLGVFIIADIAATYVIPLFRDVLDTPDPAFLKEKTIFLIACVLCFALAFTLSFRLSVKRFQQVDLQL